MCISARFKFMQNKGNMDKVKVIVKVNNGQMLLIMKCSWILKAKQNKSLNWSHNFHLVINHLDSSPPFFPLSKID